MSDIQDPAPDFAGSGAVEYRPGEAGPPGARELLRARVEARLLADPGVTSVGIGLGLAGREAIAVGVLDAGVAARLPREIEGVPIVVTVTGPVDALRRP